MCSWILEKFSFDVFKLKFREYTKWSNWYQYKTKKVTWSILREFCFLIFLISGLNFNFMKIYAFYKV